MWSQSYEKAVGLMARTACAPEAAIGADGRCGLAQAPGRAGEHAGRRVIVSAEELLQMETEGYY